MPIGRLILLVLSYLKMILLHLLAKRINLKQSCGKESMFGSKGHVFCLCHMGRSRDQGSGGDGGC